MNPKKIALTLSLILGAYAPNATAGKYSADAKAWIKANTPILGLKLYIDNKSKSNITFDTSGYEQAPATPTKHIIAPGKSLTINTKGTSKFKENDSFKFNTDTGAQVQVPASYLHVTKVSYNPVSVEAIRIVYVYHVVEEVGDQITLYSYDRMLQERLKRLPKTKPAAPNSVLTPDIVELDDIARILLSNPTKYGENNLLFYNAQEGDIILSGMMMSSMWGQKKFIFNTVKPMTCMDFVIMETPFRIHVKRGKFTIGEFTIKEIGKYRDRYALIVTFQAGSTTPSIQAFDVDGTPVMLEYDWSTPSAESSSGSSSSSDSSSPQSTAQSMPNLPPIDPKTVTIQQVIELGEKNQIYRLFGMPSDDTNSSYVADNKAAIKAIYRKLSLKFHPDKNPNDKANAETAFKEINKFYDTLELR